MSEAFDAIVIGGGITGTSVAFHLGSAGLKRVLLCERRILAAGATGKSAAFVQVAETSEPEARVTIASLPYYMHWGDLVGSGTTKFNRTGYLRLLKAEHEAQGRQHVELLRSWGVEVHILDREAVRELAPYLETSDVALAWHQPNAGYASSTAAAFSFAENAQRLGTEIREHIEVVAIEGRGGRVSGVRTKDGATIEAPIVFLAGGAWALPLLKALGLDLPVVPARTQVAHLRWPAGADPIRFMNISDYILGSYFAWHGDDARSVVIGCSAKERKPIDDLEHFNEEGDDDYAALAHERMRARIPAAAYIRREVGWAGPVTITPDRAAIVDQHPAMAGLFYVTGCNGRGFKGAPALGRALSEWAIDGKPTTLDLAPFSAKRFETGQRVSGAIEYHQRGAEFEAVAGRR